MTTTVRLSPVSDLPPELNAPPPLLAAPVRRRGGLWGRVWYAARRKDLRLNKADIFEGENVADAEALLAKVARSLFLPLEQIPELAPRLVVERYADGETIGALGAIPTGLRYITSGRVALRVPIDGTAEQTVLQLQEGDFVGQSSVTRTPATASSVALTELQVLVIPREVLDELMQNNARLARGLGGQMGKRRQMLAEATAALRPASRTIGSPAR